MVDAVPEPLAVFCDIASVNSSANPGHCLRPGATKFLMPSPDSSPPTVPHPSPWFWAKGAGLALILVLWAGAAHLASTQAGPTHWGAALALLPVVVALVLGLWSLKPRWLALTMGLVLVGALVAAWPWLSHRVALLFFLEHAGVYLLLALFFGRTLVGSAESLVTQMARRVHGGVLSPRQAVYSHQVTVAWTVFFLAMVVTSTLLFVLAPRSVWSSFANLLGGPLIALMFVGEFCCRRWLLRGEDSSKMTDAIRAWNNHNAK
jgi:uncharacterized membrane protein